MKTILTDVIPIHTRVTGRARYKVPGLRRAPDLKAVLENGLARRKGVTAVSASSVTGNLLVTFSGALDNKKVARLIAATVAQHQSAAAPVQPVSKTTRQSPAEPTRRSPPSTELPMVQSGPAGNLWHGKSAKQATLSLATDPKSGLSSDEVALRLDRDGPNRLPTSQGRTGWQIMAGQINSLPVYLLGAAAGVSLLTGGVLDAAVVVGVVAANAVIGYFTESEAEKTIESLNELVHPTAEVIRDGKVRTIPVEGVVAGDLLMLKPGTYVPADSRLLEVARLSVDESMLTGESLPVSKRTAAIDQKDLPIGERRNMTFMGTQITGGQGTALVVATGAATEIGRLQNLMDATERPETPIERQLRIIGDQLVLLCGGICGVVFLMGFMRGYGFLQMVRMAISLAAAAVPEGLPAAATINFALGIRKMREHRVLIRHLQAVETLGAVQALCLDKTGTITRNRMAVARVFAGMRTFEVIDEQLRLFGQPVAAEQFGEIGDLLRVGVLCSETRIGGRDADGVAALSGSATENALVELALQAGIDAKDLRRLHRRLRVNHRAENRHLMSSLHKRGDGQRLLAVKGSPPEVLARCRRHMVDGRPQELNPADRQAIEMENERFAGRALRVLGMACAEGTRGQKQLGEADLTWLGLVGLADPIREGVRPLVEVLHRAGIDTVMITGDQSSTAYAVAKSIDIARNPPLEILDSTQLNALDEPTMAALADKVQVYSRVSPADKLKIVQALQLAGRTVAMTGDGINDGPALKAANLGIAMGEGGTDVAREVADIVLEDDNLETLITALEDGRATYTNIRKSVHFFLATNLSEIMVMFAAMAAGIGFPLNVMQLLWINIISDIFPGLALSMEAPEPDIMTRPPRDASQPLFSRTDYRQMTLEAATISLATLGAYGYGLRRYGAGARAGTLAFQGLTLAQLIQAAGCRRETRRSGDDRRLPPNRYLTAALGGSLALQLLTIFVPALRRLLGTTPVGLVDLGVIGASAVLPLVVNEKFKPTSQRSENETDHDLHI
jgi:Ca2+-transporting ATPase